MARKGLYLCCIIILCEFVLGLSEDFWCLQCTWETYTVYSSNSSNIIAGSECIIDDLDDITKYHPDAPTPTVNPVCYYEDTANDYEDLLRGACFDNACYATGSQVCAKWSEYRNGDLMKVIRLCAIPGGTEKGCYHQSYGDDQYKVVCFCEDQEYCNAAQTLQWNVLNYLIIWVSIGIPPLRWWLIEV